MDDEAIWEKLLRSCPNSLSGLEAIVGPLEGGGEAPAEPDLWWLSPLVRADSEHAREGVLALFRPVSFLHLHRTKREHALLDAYRLVVANGRQRCEAALRERYGPPSTHQEGADSILAFHPFYLVEAEADRLDLAWCSDRPAFALPTRAPFDERVRAEVLAAMPERVAALQTIAAADGYRHSLPEASGIFPQARR